jgi:hypothetical protein
MKKVTPSANKRRYLRAGITPQDRTVHTVRFFLYLFIVTVIHIIYPLFIIQRQTFFYFYFYV